MPEEKIKSCPFCGCQDVNICRTNEYACWVECDHCGALVNSVATRAEAIKNWNKRSPTEGYATILEDDDREMEARSKRIQKKKA